jgi:MazG family protein
MREFDELIQIMARLRSAEGCPWDREQTIPMLGPYLLEEAYEVLEAVDGGEPSKLCAELGDLMLLVVFYAQIATEQGQFGISQALQRINDKLRFRHPHVFGQVQVSGPDEVVVNWEALKRQEPETGRRESALDGVPRALPALQRAFDLQKRAARVGFDWPSPDGAREKVAEEFGELQHLAFTLRVIPRPVVRVETPSRPAVAAPVAAAPATTPPPATAPAAALVHRRSAAAAIQPRWTQSQPHPRRDWPSETGARLALAP